MYSRSAVATMFMHASLSSMRVPVGLLAMSVSAAVSSLLTFVPLLLSLLSVNLIIGMFASVHPGMGLLAFSVCPISAIMIVVIVVMLTPTLC